MSDASSSDTETDDSFIPVRTTNVQNTHNSYEYLIHPRKKYSGSFSKRKVSAPSMNNTKRTTRSRSITTKDTNPIFIDVENNQNQVLDTANNPKVHIPIDLNTNIIHSGEELLYFIKHDSQDHLNILYNETCYLNKMSQETMYARVYGDGNCAFYASLLAIKQLAYEVVKFEKQKKIELILLILPESIFQDV